MYNFGFGLDWITQVPEIKSFMDQEPETLKRIFHELPIWFKSPDFDRVSFVFLFLFLFPFPSFVIYIVTGLNSTIVFVCFVIG